ncbi:hypothetical protein [Pseudomonas sp. microsymbiont 2]
MTQREKGQQFWDALPRWYKFVIIGTSLFGTTYGRWYIDEWLSWTPLFWGIVLIVSMLYCRFRDSRLRLKAMADPTITAEATAEDLSAK